jgi:hypothetical protein
MSNENQEDEVSFSRSSDYKSVYSNFFRTRVGNGDVTIIFSKFTHTSGVDVVGDVVEEQIEVVMAWPMLKILADQISSLVDAIELELCIIPTPQNAIVPADIQIEKQQQIVRSLGLVQKY